MNYKNDGILYFAFINREKFSVDLEIYSRRELFVLWCSFFAAQWNECGQKSVN